MAFEGEFSRLALGDGVVHMQDRFKVGVGQNAYPSFVGGQKHLVTTPTESHLICADRLMVGRNDGRLGGQNVEQIAILNNGQPVDSRLWNLQNTYLATN